MNQLRKPAMPEENRSIGTPISEPGIEHRAISAGTVEYDDGNPATIVPDMEARAMRDRAGDRGEATGPCAFRAPLADIDRCTAVEYDDGNPATIAAGAYGFD